MLLVTTWQKFHGYFTPALVSVGNRAELTLFVSQPFRKKIIHHHHNHSKAYFFLVYWDDYLKWFIWFITGKVLLLKMKAPFLWFLSLLLISSAIARIFFVFANVHDFFQSRVSLDFIETYLETCLTHDGVFLQILLLLHYTIFYTL